MNVIPKKCLQRQRILIYLLCKGKYHCKADLLFLWLLGFDQTSKAVDNLNKGIWIPIVLLEQNKPPLHAIESDCCASTSTMSKPNQSADDSISSHIVWLEPVTIDSILLSAKKVKVFISYIRLLYTSINVYHRSIYHTLHMYILHLNATYLHIIHCISCDWIRLICLS